LATLLKAGASVAVRDKKDNYPLHYAVKFCLKRDGFRGLRASLVKPLVAKMPHGSLGDENRSGVTCRHLLRGLDLKAQLAEQKLSSSEPSDTSDEDDWNEKLANADYEDRAAQRLDLDSHQFVNDYRETYDQWADRIYAEFVRRRHTAPAPKLSAKKKHPESAFKIKDEPLKLPAPPVKPSRPSRAQKKYAALFSLTKISVEDMPFDENSTSDEIMSVILSNVEGSDPSRLRIREAVRKWHPDKFTQMLGACVVEKDRPRVMNIVTIVSQALLTYGKT